MVKQPRKSQPQEVVVKRPVGRPSKYKPEYCQEIVTFCSQGYSITGFAGSIGVSRDCILEWANTHPEFSVAVKRAKAATAFAYEESAKKIREEGGGNGSATITLFGLKNFAPDEYTDRSEVRHSGGDGGAIQMQTTVLDAGLMSPEEREVLRGLLQAAKARKEGA